MFKRLTTVFVAEALVSSFGVDVYLNIVGSGKKWQI